MKNFLLINIFLFWSSIIIANNPQKIYSIARQNLSAEHYHEQLNLWQKELDKNAQNADAWFNYFMAHQLLFQKGKMTVADLERANNKIQEALPNSFEAHFAQYCLDNSISSLQKAYQLAPHRYETYAPLMNYYETTQDPIKVAELSKKWLASNEYSSGLLQWNYNVLIGLEKEAIILTEDDNHTHPLWLLQYGKNIRSDVAVLNLPLLGNADYRNAVFKKLNIPVLMSNDQVDIVQHLTKNCLQKALYLGISLSKNLVKEHEEELYIVGLAFRHSTDDYDNVSALIDNYENKFLLDHLKVNLTADVSTELVAQNNLNYLPAFLILHGYYKEKNDWTKANAIKELSFKIAAAAQKEEELKAYLNKSFKDGSSQPMVNLSYRDIEDAFMPMAYHHNLYAAATEVSNKEYELFLSDLLLRKEFDQLQARKIYKTDWRSFLTPVAKNLGEEVLYENGKPDNPNAPIQNISYESAVAYCEWLTAVYNNQQHKKKKYKRVVFRLPTDKEWQWAASTLSPNIDSTTTGDYQFKYSWKAYYHKNQNGCFLANFNTNEEVPCETCPQTSMDGAFFTANVDSYFPNEYGLYNTIGNVAEMIQEKGKAKGGSWFHTPNNSTIQAIQNYVEPQPYIGFRVFMEVLEEQQDNPKKGMVGPPGTLQLKGKLFMDETERTNIDWKEYCFWLKTNDSANYNQCVLDTIVWIESLSYNEPYVNHYHQHPAYNEYPVVGVSYEQAKKYCAWRTARVNEMLALNPTSLKRFGKVLYRLPTEAEWEYAAQGGLDKQLFPYGLEALETSKGATANFKIPKDKLQGVAGSLNADASITAPVRSYLPNKKGFYNMIGNVAEIVQEEGVSKGGSWFHEQNVMKVKDKITYTKPMSWLGFRCICETNL